MQAGTVITSALHVATDQASGSQTNKPIMFHEQWPTLAAAMGQRQQNLAEDFSRNAYHCVREGLITGSDRKRLAHEAAEMGLRPFDAQLLIACAIRQWALDRPVTGMAKEKFLCRKQKKSHSAVSHRWWKFAAVGLVAVIIDSAIILLWL